MASIAPTRRIAVATHSGLYRLRETVAERRRRRAEELGLGPDGRRQVGWAQSTAALISWSILTGIAAWYGYTASLNVDSFYASLDRPSWAVPASILTGVWVGMYVAMAAAAWLVWRERGLRGAPISLAMYALQLVPSALFLWYLFVEHNGAWALVDASILWLLVAATMVGFGLARPMAGFLLVPYLFWVTYSAALTASLWARNPGLL